MQTKDSFNIHDTLLIRTLYGYEEKGSLDICKKIED